MTSSAQPAPIPPPTSPSAAAYQRHRLWSGVLGIGAVLTLLWTCVAMGLADLFPAADSLTTSALSAAFAALTIGLVVSIVQFPFDYYAGRVVEGKFRQVDVNTPYPWTRQYLIGLAAWLATLCLSGAVVGGVYFISSDRWPIIAGAILVTLSLLYFALPFAPGPRTRPGVARRAWVEQLRAELTRQNLPVPSIAFYEHGEKSLAGGWAGVGKLRTLWIASTLWDLPPRLAAALIARELTHLRDGHRLLSMMSTAVWSIAGLVLTSILLRYTENPTAPQVVILTAATMSTWCWIGLLCVWPALGRWQVLAADRGMLTAGFTLEESLAALAELSARNKPDDTLPATIAYIFHPIPPMAVRRESLQTNTTN